MNELIVNLSSAFSAPWARSWLTSTALFGVGGAIMLGWVAALAIGWIYGERRIAGFLQGRLGPNRVGPYGLFQSFADGIKLLTKEDIVPAVASKFLYTTAPLLVFVGAFLPFLALPFSERWVVANLQIGLFYILAFEAIEVIGVLMAGWAPGSKWSLYGGMRLAAQMLSYEVPMGLCVLVVIVLAGSLNLADVVAWQAGPAWGLENPSILGWAIFRSPAALLAFVLFFVGGLASTKRAPFDLPEAESELVAGYHTEYTGMRFAFFFLAEYASMYVICAIAAILFLGGWHAPIPRPSLEQGVTLLNRFLELRGQQADVFSTLLSQAGDGPTLKILAHEAIGAINLVLKSFALYFVMIWARWSLPRIRIDQVMYICLKVLLPFSLGCAMWAMIQVVLW